MLAFSRRATGVGNLTLREISPPLAYLPRHFDHIPQALFGFLLVLFVELKTVSVKEVVVVLSRHEFGDDWHTAFEVLRATEAYEHRLSLVRFGVEHKSLVYPRFFVALAMGFGVEVQFLVFHQNYAVLRNSVKNLPPAVIAPEDYFFGNHTTSLHRNAFVPDLFRLVRGSFKGEDCL